MNEKINDIYVNRNVCQLYSNGTKPHRQKSIATTTAYDGNSYIPSNTYKGFYLHYPSNNNNKKLFNDSNDSTVENKQKIDHNELTMGNNHLLQ